MHEHQHRHHGELENIKLAFFLNLSFTVIEIIGGLLTNSTAILADAVHDMGDTIALAQAWYFESLTKNKGSQRYTYGYKRFSLFGALFSSMILVLSSVYVLSEAIPRLLNPEPSHAPGMIFLAVIGVLVNGFAVLRLSKNKGINAQVVKYHMLEDTLGWVAILVIGIILLFKEIHILDPILSIVLTVYILVGVTKNLIKASDILLQATPDEVETEKLKAEIEAIENVSCMHHFHIWSLDGELSVLTAHLVATKALDADEYAAVKDKVSVVVEAHGLFHSTIELEWPEENCRIGASDCC